MSWIASFGISRECTSIPRSMGLIFCSQVEQGREMWIDARQHKLDETIKSL
jgi:hypothetical protein